MRRLWRIPGVIALLLGGLLTVLAVFPWIGLSRRETCIAWWSRALLLACGVRVREVVAPGGQALSAMRGQQGPGQGRLLLPNHISWLDISVHCSIPPAVMLAKSEISRWPPVAAPSARGGPVPS